MRSDIVARVSLPSRREPPDGGTAGKQRSLLALAGPNPSELVHALSRVYR
jgi:hypothetical protein